MPGVLRLTTPLSHRAESWVVYQLTAGLGISHQDRRPSERHASRCNASASSHQSAMASRRDYTRTASESAITISSLWSVSVGRRAALTA